MVNNSVSSAPSFSIASLQSLQLLFFSTTLAALSGLWSCQSSSSAASGKKQEPVVSSLANSRWILQKFVSNSDRYGVQSPKEGQIFQAFFEQRGIVRFRLDCNLAVGGWATIEQRENGRGSLSFGLMASTLALCSAPNLAEKFLRNIGNIVSYVIEGPHLHMNLKMDGGDYVWLYQGQGNAPK